MSEDITRKRIGIFALAVLLSIGFCHLGMAGESSVSVSPQTITVSPGDAFTIDIVVDAAGSEIFGADCKLQFDNAILNATSQTGGTFLGQGGANTIEVQNSIDNDAGIVKYGETRMGDPDVIGSATEKGVLATITFEAIGSGTTDMKLESKLSDSSAQLIDATTNDGTCRVLGTVASGEAHTSDDKSTSEQVPRKPENKWLPGFGAGCLIIGLIGALLLMRS